MDLTILPSRNGTRPLFLKQVDRSLYDTSAGQQLKAKKAATRKLVFLVAGSVLAAVSFMVLACHFVR